MDFSTYGLPSEEWLNFVSSDNLSETFPPQQTRDAILHLRQAVNRNRERTALNQLQETGLADKVVWKDFHLPTANNLSITVRKYVAKYLAHNTLPAYIHLHGGGYLFGSLSSEQYFCSVLANASKSAVLHICYRHTPEEQFPAQHDDAWAGYSWIMANVDMLRLDFDRVIVGGISAGAALAAGVIYRDLAMMRKSKRRSRIASAVLSMPFMMHPECFPFEHFTSPQKTSPLQCQDAPVLSKKWIDFFISTLGPSNVADTLLNIPLAPDEALAGWPPTAFVVCGMDPVRDEALFFAQKLHELGSVND